MAEAIFQEEESFICPICLDMLEDPVSIQCGHNFCMKCIESCWDQENPKGIYSCPLCKHTFTPRPVVFKNPLVAEIVKKLKETRIQADTPTIAVPGDVQCDICTGSKPKAVKTCLDCLMSYCETHYKLHNEMNPRQTHKVIDATCQLQERICSQHKRPLEIFCRTDQRSICYVCTMDEHKNHDTVSATAERTQKQTKLAVTKRLLQQKVQEREKQLEELKKAVVTFKSSAQTAVDESDRTFSEIIRTMKRRSSEVKEMIRAQEKAEVSRAEGLLKRLKQEIAELKKRETEVEQLLRTDDHIHFLKIFQSASDPTLSKDSSRFIVNQDVSFEAVKKSVSILKGHLEYHCNQGVATVSAVVRNVVVTTKAPKASSVTSLKPALSLESPQPRSRKDFLKYYTHFTLDPNTASNYLYLSHGNKKLGYDYSVLHPDHPDRFDWESQVLCKEGVNGRSYWEVDVKSGEIHIAVAYKGITRKGNHSRFGSNKQSWSVKCSSSGRKGVYVDHSAGILDFYNVSQTMILMRSVRTTFTHTLYPGFRVYEGTVKLL